MSHTYERERSCSGKIGYTSRGDARRTIDRMRNKDTSRQRGELRPYMCEYCGAYHIGHKRIAKVDKRR